MPTIPPGWLDRATELTRDPDPAWAQRGAEILAGDL